MLKLKRIIKYGYSNFLRNRFITISTIFIMTTTLFVIGLALLGDALLDDVVLQTQKQVDVTVYFNPGVEEELILDFRDSAKEINGVSSVRYVSQGMALAEYRERHTDDKVLISGLDQLEENPLRARLHIQANDSTLYGEIAETIQSRDLFSDARETIIDKVNFFENELLIERLNSFIASSQITTTIIIIVLILSSFVIIFMTERITIHSNRDEIALMNLVGAGKVYTVGPFIVEGVLYGAVGAIAAFILLYPFSLWVGPLTQDFFGGLNLLSYYTEQIFSISFILLLIGVGISIISTFIAVRRYRK